MAKFAILNAFFLSSCLMLTSCGTFQSDMFYKKDTPISKKQLDFDNCKIASFKTIPQVVKTEMTSSSYTEPSISCSSDKASSCDLVGGSYTPSESYNVEINASLRTRFIDRCLTQKGYQKLRLPRCKNDQERMMAMNAKNAAELICNPDPALQE